MKSPNRRNEAQPMKVYGFVLEHEHLEGTLRYLPRGCTDVLIYSDDASTLREAPVGDHRDQRNDFEASPAFATASGLGKYKLDIAVRAVFPRYRLARPVDRTTKETTA